MAARSHPEADLSAVRPAVGTSVVIRVGRLSGQSGVVTWSGRDGGCGCWSLIVRTERGEWYGKLSEVMLAVL